MKKVYVVGDAKHYADFITGVKLVNNIEEAEIVIFTGGEDVDPVLYGATRHPLTFCNSDRDNYEAEMFKKIKTNQLVIGICRGSQFLCVMNDGKLVQHVTGHGLYETHEIYNPKTGMTYDITSTHHQMQYPFNLDSKDYTLLYVSLRRRSNCYEGDNINEFDIVTNGEPEIVMYHKENMPFCLAIQGHPEYMRKEAPVVKMLNTLISNTLKTLA